MQSRENEDFRADLYRKIAIWHRLSVGWDLAHWIIGALGIACSALAAAQAVVGTYWAPYFAVAATIFFGVLGFANPQRQSARFLRAYVILDCALRENKLKLIDDRQLLNAHRRAEEHLTSAIQTTAFSGHGMERSDSKLL